ncbi:MAG: DUF502 domain-containing protein [bacterium]
MRVWAMGNLRAKIKTIFIAGLVVTIPILVTIFLIWWAFDLVDGFLAPIYDRILGYHFPGLGFVSTILLIFLVGLVATNVVGQRLLSWGEAFLSRIPLFKIVYLSVKQMVDAFSPQNRTSFKRFVLVEYPRKGVFSFGFLTDHSVLESEEQRAIPLAAVYIPTNHLYLGEIVLFPREELYYSDLTIEEGIRIILSGGIATPSRLTVRGSGSSLPN